MRRGLLFCVIGVICSCFMYLISCNKYDFKEEGAKEISELIKNSKVKILDVRTNGEFAGGHIENAINIDVSNDNFLDECKRVFSKDDIIVVYCHAGSRSRKAASILKKNGFNVVNLRGGIVEWKGAKFPVVA